MTVNHDVRLNEKCPCRRKGCERHGDCEACKSHHYTEKPGILPACERIRIKNMKKRKSE